MVQQRVYKDIAQVLHCNGATKSLQIYSPGVVLQCCNKEFTNILHRCCIAMVQQRAYKDIAQMLYCNGDTKSLQICCTCVSLYCNGATKVLVDR